MKVSLDGGLTFVDAREGVRVIYEDVDIPGEDEEGELHVNLTEEGIILDVWVSRAEPLDHNIATSSETVGEIVERLVEKDS